MKELTVSANNANLGIVTDFISEEMEKSAFDMKQIMQVSLVIEEVFTNIANYAYSPKDGDVSIRACADEDKVVIEFQDSGAPYDPLAKEDPDITLSADDRKIGGLGIFLTKKMMDDVQYEYVDGKNVFIITKNK